MRTLCNRTLEVRSSGRCGQLYRDLSDVVYLPVYAQLECMLGGDAFCEEILDETIKP
jgi:hypothetical protein